MTTGTNEAMLTLSAAVKASGLSLSTLRRHLAAGRIAGASRTATGWAIPISGLIAAGYAPRTTPPDSTPSRAPTVPTGPGVDGSALRDENTRLRAELLRLEAETEAQRRHLADLQKALDVLARALPPAPNTEVTPPTIAQTTPPTVARWWHRRRR
jgi:hypothetical protein